MLRRWGDGLTRDEREEVRAAGRAILLLSDEVECLHIDLWHASDGAEPSAVEPEPEPDGEKPAPWLPAPSAADVGVTLRDRISAFRLKRD